MYSWTSEERLIMANLFFGDLLIMGEESEIEKLLESIAITESDEYAPNWNTDSTIFSFHKVVPIPKHIIDMESKDDISDDEREIIEKWRKDNWGTTSDASHVSVVDNGTEEVIVAFDTKYAPPIHIIHALQKKFLNLDISYTYLEPNFEIAGEVDSQGMVKVYFGDDYCRIYDMFFGE